MDQYCGVDVVLQGVPFGWIRSGHHSLIGKNCTLMIDEEGGQTPLIEKPSNLSDFGRFCLSPGHGQNLSFWPCLVGG